MPVTCPCKAGVCVYVCGVCLCVVCVWGMGEVLDACITHKDAHLTCPCKQVIFHFKTFGVSDPQDTDPDADQLIDDTRELGLAPFELLIGREFKVPVWEDMVKSMTVGEVARFGCMFKVKAWGGGGGVGRVRVVCRW